MWETFGLDFNLPVPLEDSGIDCKRLHMNLKLWRYSVRRFENLVWVGWQGAPDGQKKEQPNTDLELRDENGEFWTMQYVGFRTSNPKSLRCRITSGWSRFREAHGIKIGEWHSSEHTGTIPSTDQLFQLHTLATVRTMACVT